MTASKQVYKCPKCRSPKTVWNLKSRAQRHCKECGNFYTIDTQNNLDRDRETIKELSLRLKEERRAHEDTTALLNKFSNMSKKEIKPPNWLAPKKTVKKDRSIASTMLSDCHLDEVVEPCEINYVNGYNRKIAKRRLKLFFENSIRLSRDHMSGLTIEGMVLSLGGDMVSGNIHDELKQSNEDGIMGTVFYWVQQLAAGIELFANEYDKVHIPCVTGNHGRNSMKPVMKGRVRDNFDWLIYKFLEMHFKNDPSVTFAISGGTDERFKIYDTRYQLTHGDQFRGGSGISGINTPIMLGDHRKRQVEVATGTPYDILLMGHFHQRKDFGKVMINGSLKGYDEFASKFNFGFEMPQQWFWLTDSVYGKTITAPVHVYKRGEGWELD